MVKVCEKNGFVIKQKESHEMGVLTESHRAFVVYHPGFDGVFIVDNLTFAEAEKFCEENNADEWGEKLLNF